MSLALSGALSAAEGRTHNGVLMLTKTLLLFLPSFLIFFLLTACSSQSGATSTLTAAAPALMTSTPEVGCSVISAEPTPNVSSVLPPVTSADYTRGPQNASATMVAYCDFQSAQCEIFNRVLDELGKNHPNDLRVVLRPLPAIGVLDKSQISVQAALAAGNQGKFWEMRDLLHAKYNDWANLSAAQFETWIAGQAAGLGLNGAKFKADLKSPATETSAKSMYDAARQIGISNIPTVFINGSLQSRAALSYEGLDSTIGLVALGARQYKSCPPFTIGPSKQYTATLHTEKGDIVIQLFPDKAPLAVNSFVFLARQGWFDGVTFHRVIPGFVAQTGDPSGTSQGGPGYFFKNEVHADLKFDKPGVVGMANSGPDTNGSQFFITYAPAPNLDGSYTVFGQVTQGMEVLEKLTPRDAQQTPNPPPGDKLLSVTIEEK
jgi:cyclophilin family peptidyl-prolyl cis-trans isomerase/protein-disulfide isomerase